MKKKASALLNIMLAISLLTSMFFMTTTSSSSSPSGYDPWLDTDDDGDIDFDDIVALAMCYGTSGTPINKTAVLLELQERVDSLNASLLELQDRVSTIEEEKNQVKMIRFVEPSETIADESIIYKVAATFTWIPENKTNNAILSTAIYLESKMLDWAGDPSSFYAHVSIYTGEVLHGYAPHEEFYGVTGEYGWTGIGVVESYWSTYGGLVPQQNQSSYTLMLEVQGSYTHPVYVRNVHLFLTVMDGMLVSYP